MKSGMKPIPALLPVSWLYALGIVLWNMLFDWNILRTGRVNVPVISVGNITTGGTGKTPVVESIARLMEEQKLRCAIVSRGYRRATRGLVEVSDGTKVKASSQDAGDEAYQLATRLPGTIVVVDEDRLRGAQHAVRLGASVVVLDDGFQHRRLHRDLDVVCMDISHSAFTMPMLPAGHRRDTLSSLKRADVVLFNKASTLEDLDKLRNTLSRYSKAKVFTSQYKVVSFRRAKTRFSVDLAGVKGKQAVAFCGIGQPDSFRKSLEGLGLRVNSLMAFGDHHPYTDVDLRSVVSEQERVKAEYIVTTEKDVARLASNRFIGDHPVFYIEMEMKIDHEKEWIALIKSTNKK